VSPTYMDEIQTAHLGEGLDGVLRNRTEDLIGILNGIDNDLYDPEEDGAIAAPFSSIAYDQRLVNKCDLQTFFELPIKEDVPVVAMISRLTKQKGVELVQAVFHELMETGSQFIVLGTGDPEFEGFFNAMASQYPLQCKVWIGFDEKLAHKIYAGSDLFLMPSKFEPCGLSQLIAMRYGSVPIVRETGGLNDTVKSFDEFTEAGNGFSFKNFNAHDMLYTIERAIRLFRNRGQWPSLVQKVMELDFSWEQSARQYHQLYMDIISRG
ncbi:MAG: glycosyltransferase, partial [Bacillota bacterium]|nr:glycosyltransferase [Bacillota bacterium]